MVSTNSQRWSTRLFPNNRKEPFIVGEDVRGKSSKEETSYRQSMDEATSKKSCAECKNYLHRGSFHSECSKVAGIVQADDICDLFTARSGVL